MTEQNPYQSGAGDWGPGHPPGPSDTPPPGYGYPGAGAPAQGYGHPQQPPGTLPMGGAPLISIGDITVMGDQIITPAGQLPLRGAVWNATDMSRTEEKIPAHAIVLTVVFALLRLLGLLFLLMKEKRSTGYIQVTVTSGGRHHQTMVPALGPETFPAVMGQINYARSLSSM
ncbi:hypothetical protein [Streptomyces sp. WP-1]|uniref:hypothetical protein n=1 Tax=Streptomyces sp. WP-1 TaxID=3041497 RepID=UPI00264897F0|nr:hypothetical protein [Streptomyces sp. WP-1]WKE70068.1 hypothetical protein QHG49_13955 [Streptomyces sp. WP-1]